MAIHNAVIRSISQWGAAGGQCKSSANDAVVQLVCLNFRLIMWIIPSKWWRMF